MDETKQITSKIEIPQSMWEQNKEFIEERDKSRRTSDKHYTEKMLRLAHEYVKEKIGEQADVMRRWDELKAELDEAVNGHE